MNDQYYTREPESASHPVNCAVLFRGHSLQFETDAGVFSKGELDKGTELLLSALGGDAHLLGDVLLVQLVERVERHVWRSLHLPQEVHLPGCSGLLCLESALGLLLALPGPIAVIALDVVGAALVVLIDRHSRRPSFRSSARQSSRR